MAEIEECDLEVLATGMPGVTPALGKVFAEAAAVCLEHNQHVPGVLLPADGQFTGRFRVKWSNVTDQQRRTHKDLQDATEFGACGLAVLIVHRQTGLVVVERSCKGTGFDFWLGNQNDFLFQSKARLEVSGILSGGEAEISSRVMQKLAQISRWNVHLPGYVAVVEFGSPKARLMAIGL